MGNVDQPEVAENKDVLLADEDVRRLDVAVNYVFVVKKSNRSDY